MEKEIFNLYKNALTGTPMIEPLCEDYKNRWKACHDDKEKLVALSLGQQSIPWFATMCYVGKGVTRQYITSEYKDYVNGYTIHNADGVEGYTYGLYVDYPHDKDLLVDKDVVHIMWTVGASVIVKETKCPTIYVSNRSKIHLVCGGYNTVKVYVFDRSQVMVEDADDTCKVVVYEYGEGTKVDTGKFCLCDVKQFHKELRL